MKKNYILTLFLTLCLTAVTFGQGTEPFTNSTATSSYADGSFVGEAGISWTYVASRNANGDANNSGINLPALMLRRVASGSKITSSTISGGIGDFSVKLYKGFTGGGNRQVELFVNGVSKGTSTPFDDFNEQIFTVAGINVTGDVVIELVNTTSKQIIIDDISWTAPSAEPSLSITAPSNNAVIPSSTTDVSVVLNIANFNLPGNNGAGATDSTGDGYMKAKFEVTGETTQFASFFTTTIPAIEVVPGKTYTVTMELVDNSGNSLTPIVSSTVTFSVEYPCDLTLDTIKTSCNTETMGVDTYNISIPFTGGNTSTYTLTTDSGTISGDDPSTAATGTITILNVSESTNVVFTIKGDVSNSICNVTRNITSPTCVPAPTCPAVGAIIVTEIMQNPSAVGDSSGEYFEIYNTTNASIDMQGWTIKSLTSTSKNHVIASSLIVPANGYAVLGINSDSATNGGITVNYQYSSNFFLGNSSDSIALDCGATIIDAVSWDNGATFPDPAGKSMELALSKYSATENDNGVNWGEATTEINAGGDLGSPGTANSFTLSLQQNAITGFTIHPNPISNHRLTIASASSKEKSVSIYNLLGKRVFVSNFSGLKKELDISPLNTGMYILKVTEANKTATKKLVIR